jgi:hypothetical protein
VNLVNEVGRRISFYDGRDVPGQALSDELWLSQAKKAQLVHVSIMSFAKSIIARLVADGVPVSTDLHDWDGKTSTTDTSRSCTGGCAATRWRKACG